MSYQGERPTLWGVRREGSEPGWCITHLDGDEVPELFTTEAEAHLIAVQRQFRSPFGTSYEAKPWDPSTRLTPPAAVATGDEP